VKMQTYQEKAMRTATYKSGNAQIDCHELDAVLCLCEHAGAVAEAFKKALRDNDQGAYALTTQQYDKIKLNLGMMGEETVEILQFLDGRHVVTAPTQMRLTKACALLGLWGEAGEVTAHLKHTFPSTRKTRTEIGDLMWYIAAVCSYWGYSLTDACRENLAKLKDRAKRGVLKGDGSAR